MCFMAMPITVQSEDRALYGDDDHWLHVMQMLFQPALDQAGFSSIPPLAQGADVIHGGIIKNLSIADLVLVDLSSRNPNVFFELGVRTSLNLPIALVADEHTKLPFDTAGINTHRYDSRLQVWDIEKQISALEAHVRASWESCGGANPLWQYFGLTLKALEPTSSADPLTARVDLLTDGVSQLQHTVESVLIMQQRERRRRDDLDLVRSTPEASPTELAAYEDLKSVRSRRRQDFAVSAHERVPNLSLTWLPDPGGFFRDGRFVFDARAMSEEQAIEVHSLLQTLAHQSDLDVLVDFDRRAATDA